jgi:predicted HicB family RNase H-like nuclease
MIETDRQQEALRAAHDLFVQNPDWVKFYREILGLHGVVRQHFPRREALAAFEQTEAYQEIQQMLRKLRERSVAPTGGSQEPTRVITVRLPRSLHEALRAEAHEHQTSMNKLCISKLLQFIDNELIPIEH